MERKDHPETGERKQSPEKAKRQPYEKPAVVDRGRLVEIALGGSPGGGDSGGGALTENPLT